MLHNTRSRRRNEKPVHHNEECPCSPQLEKVHAREEEAGEEEAGEDHRGEETAAPEEEGGTGGVRGGTGGVRGGTGGVRGRQGGVKGVTGTWLIGPNESTMTTRMMAVMKVACFEGRGLVDRKSTRLNSSH